VNLAKLHNIPRYACGVSKKFTKKIKIKLRNPKEVWAIKNKNIKVENPPFDKTPLKNLTGIISEFGVLTPKKFVKKANQ
jgi:translation initiation factor 2B subunit (eIF-2B alpha/beta/delta family)